MRDLGIAALQNGTTLLVIEMCQAVIGLNDGRANLEDACWGGVAASEIYSFSSMSYQTGKSMNPQIVELIGRNYLTSELLKAGFEVAQPLRDRGIDLIAYIDIDDEIDRFVAIPMQLKAASQRSFSIDRKYNKFPNLIMVYVWNVLSDEASVIYALTQKEAVLVGDEMGYTATVSW